METAKHFASIINHHTKELITYRDFKGDHTLYDWLTAAKGQGCQVVCVHSINDLQWHERNVFNAMTIHEQCGEPLTRVFV